MGWLTKALTRVAARYVGPEDIRLVRALGGAESYAGKTVSVDSSLGLAANWACVRLISQTVGTLPVEIAEWDGTSWRPTRSHSLYGLMHDAPNADMSAVEFWSAMVMALMTWGNAYAEVFRAGGRVIAIAPLSPRLVVPCRRKDGALEYRYSDPDGFRVIGEENVLHVKGLSHDGLIGLSPIAHARHALGLAMAADEAAGKLFSDGLRVPGHYVLPNILSAPDREKMREAVAAWHGAQAAGRAPVLEGGMKFESATMPPQDAELLATRSFSVEEICRFYGVPPYMVGHTSKSTSWGTGLEQQMLAFHQLTLRPILKNIEQAIRRRLLTPAERGRISIEFNVEGLLRADSQGRAEYLQKMVGGPIMSVNEGRAIEGLPPKPGCDDVVTQSNMMPMQSLGDATSRDQLPAPNARTLEGDE
jgi:HK97 family phage portal protein